MKRDIDLSLLSRIIFLTIITVIIGYTFFSIMKENDNSKQKQADQVKLLLEKAAVQCFALEGAYPNSLEYLSKYGVIFNEEKFYFRYEMNDIGNYMPQIYVTPK